MPLRAYAIANTLGVAALTLTLSAIAWSVAGTARRYGDVVHSVEIAFAEGEQKITDPEKRSVQRPRVFYRRELEANQLVIAKP